MMTALSGIAATQQAVAPQLAAAAVASSAPAAASRVTAQDTVNISAAGHQAASAAGDVDHDGDSH